MAVAVVLLLAAMGGGVGWWAHRRAAQPAAAGTVAGAPDARAARLLRAVQAQPSAAGPHRELGAYYLESGQPYEALWELAVARELGAHDPALTLHMTEALQRAGLSEAALRLLSDARHEHPGQRSLDLALARANLQVAEPEAALQVVRRIPALAGSPDGLLLLARANLALGDIPAARAELQRARMLADSGPRGILRLELGRIALAVGDGPAARADLNAAARDDPEDEAAQYYAGLADAASPGRANTAVAIEHFKLATRADPRQARAGVELGRLLYEKAGQWEQAAEVYRRALSMDPRCLKAEEGLARVRAALHQPGEAVYHQARVRELEDRPIEALPLYRRWGELRPERWDSVLRAAECSMDMQRYLDAAREVQRGLQRYPNNPELYSHLAQLYLRTDSRPEAVRLCDRWAPVDRASGRPEWVRGQLAAKALRDEEAIRWFETAVRKSPELGAFHASLGEVLAHQPTPERLRRARAELERATMLDPGMALFQDQLGLVLQQSGELESARRVFLRALDRDSVQLDAYRGLMIVARRLGRPGAADFFAALEREVRDQQRDEGAARRDLSAQPRDARARLALARALLRRGELAEARNYLAVAAEQPDGELARPLLRRVERLLSVL